MCSSDLVYSSCKAAIQDCDFAIRTAVRKRSSKFRHYSCKDTLTYLNKRSRIFSNVAVIFGRENNGLTNQEINFCNIISYIPIKTIYQSMNLAQAVMVYAYSFASLLINEGSPKIAKADESTIRKPKNRIAELLPKIGVEPSTKIYFQILVRIAALNADDLKLLYYVLKKLENSFLAQR